MKKEEDYLQDLSLELTRTSRTVLFQFAEGKMRVNNGWLLKLFWFGVYSERGDIGEEVLASIHRAQLTYGLNRSNVLLHELYTDDNMDHKVEPAILKNECV